MTTNQPPTVEERLSRLELLFSNVAETVLAQNDAIAALGANIQNLTETVDRVATRVDILTENVDRVTARVDTLAAEAAQDRQQAAIDRQQAAIDRQEIRRIWEYLRDRNGGSAPPQVN